MASPQFRILCLHGYHQDSIAMKLKMGGLRKTLKKCEFIYIDAPNSAPDSSNVNQDQKQLSWGPRSLSWFNNTSDGSFKYDANGKPVGFDESIKALDECLQNLGPFDIILGFSQGACMAALYISELSLKGTVPFKAAILVSGFDSKVDSLQYLTQHTISIPSFHVFSPNDTVIPHEATKEFMKHFDNPEYFVHEGGHGFPSASILKVPLIDFLKRVKENSSIVE